MEKYNIEFKGRVLDAVIDAIRKQPYGTHYELYQNIVKGKGKFIIDARGMQLLDSALSPMPINQVEEAYIVIAKSVLATKQETENISDNEE